MSVKVLQMSSCFVYISFCIFYMYMKRIDTVCIFCAHSAYICYCYINLSAETIESETGQSTVSAYFFASSYFRTDCNSGTVSVMTCKILLLILT